jgi:hypothetical protein
VPPDRSKAVRKTISVTVQVDDGAELVVYSGVVSGSDPESPTRSVAEYVVRAMLRTHSTRPAVLRHYVGPVVVGTVSILPQ